MDTRIRGTYLNGEPVVFRGCTFFEFLSIGVMCCLAGLLAGLMLGVPFGSGIAGSGLGFLAGLGLALVGAGALTRLKRGRPDGYHLHIVQVWLHVRGLWHCPFLLRTGLWDNTRTPW